MRSSSETQPEFDFAFAYQGRQSQLAEREGVEEGGLSGGVGKSGTTGGLPSFTYPANVLVEASRRAGRLNASTISPQEVENLLRERQLLLDKKFTGTLTQAESVRLEYVRWSLDRIEDAREGEVMDALEAWVSQYEMFRADLQYLRDHLTSRTRGSRR